MRKLVPLSVLIVAACTAPRMDAESNAPAPVARNIVFVLVDDLGYMDIGANNPECFYDTPNIDRLAESATRFTAAYAACPVCSPTRASILTGKYPVGVGITDYINPNGGNQPEHWRRDTKLLPAAFELQLALDEVTLAEALRAGGYATFFAGKWHLGGEGFFPEDQGFDVNRGGLARGGPYGGDKYFSPYGNPKLSDGPAGEHLPARLAAETIAFIEAQAGEPFFAMLSFYSVHTPLIGRPDLVAKYEDKRALEPAADAWRPEGSRKTRIVQDHAVYAAMVEAMDQAVGDVLDALERLELADDTIVVFFSDNGGLSTSEGHPTSNEPLRAGKGWLYEGGVREPCIVRVPGRTTAASVCERALCSTDFMPTLLELVGLAPPAGVDGESFSALLDDPKSASERDPIYWHYPHYGNQGGSPGAAILDGDYKLIEFFESGECELYDLANDPSERRDLARVRPDVVRELRAKLSAWRAASGAIMPAANPAYGTAAD